MTTFAVAPRLKAIALTPGSPPPAALHSAEKRLELLPAVNTLLGLAGLLVVAILWAALLRLPRRINDANRGSRRGRQTESSPRVGETA